MNARVDAIEKVTGRAVYADDIVLGGMLHARPVHAEHSHAEIVSVDVCGALAIGGVVDVVTARDVPGSNLVGGIVRDHQVLAAERVLYAGDVVAVVAAQTPEAAAAGAAAVRVAYRPLEPLLDPEEALRPGAPALHPECPDNVVMRYHVRHGDAAAGLAGSEVTVEREYRTQYVEHAYLEPEACVAVPEADGAVSVFGGMQHPFTTRRFVAAATGLPLARVRVVQTTLGGGFGGKDDTISVVCARAAILALRAHRPVKLVYTREESLRESYKRHPFRARYRAGAGRDGRLRAMDVRITADSGPYCTTSPFVIWRPTVQCTGPYVVPAVFCESTAVYTNGPLTGAMRGFGSPQINFAIESTIDDLAAAVGLDPVEFRKRNFFTQGCTTHTGQKLDGHTVSIAQVLDVAIERFGWREAYARCSRGKPGPDGLLHGVGLACSYRGVSLGAEGNDFCSALVNVQPDGSVVLQVGVAENGQGLKTVMTRILCGELGIDPSLVRYLDVDTSQVPDGGPTVASRGTLVGGNAVIDAARRIREMMSLALAEILGQAPPASCAGANTTTRNQQPTTNSLQPVPLEFAGGRVRHPDTGKSLSWKEAVFACHGRRIHLSAMGTWRGPFVDWDEERGRGDAYFTYVYGCNVAQVSVDPKRGTVTVNRLLGVYDVGRAIDPEGVRGQIYGGLAMGLGFTLSEEVEVDGEGRIRSVNFDRYRIPKATAMPVLDAAIVENADPAGPWGAKSIGEPANELVAPAVCNAIFHATGVRVTRLPVRPHDLVQGLRSPAPFEACGPVRPAPAAPAAPSRPLHEMRLRVNGVLRSVRAGADTLLIDVLRERLRLTGTKRGCGIGQCGTCTVLVGGKARRACRLKAAAVGDADVLTIEGLAPPGGGLHPIQRAFVEAGAVHCGFCTPGMVLATKALLDRNPHPSDADIRRALAGNLCRCTGYEQIVAAVRAAALGPARAIER